MLDLETGMQTIQEIENNSQSNVISATSFDNISYFLSTRKYPDGLNLNQKRTLRKAAINFTINDGNLYYIGKGKNERRLVILSDEKKRTIFQDCHSCNISSHFGQKKTLEKIESLFFWRGMVKDVITWIQQCEFCKGKEDKRQPSSKKLRRITSQPDLYTSPYPSATPEDAEDHVLSQKIQLNPHNIVDNLAQYLQILDHYEKEILIMSSKAELCIDEALDHLLSKVIRCITRRKRELKLKVIQHKEDALEKVKQARRRLEVQLDPDARKESVRRDIPTEPQLLLESTFKTCQPNSSTEMPHRENFGGVWATFDVDRARGEFEIAINSCGNITNNPPYSVSHVLQVPAGIRLSASETSEGSRESIRGKKLRLFCRPHIPGGLSEAIDESSCSYFRIFQDEQLPVCYVSRLEPHQVYEFYLSYQEEGLADWSPWSYPYLASTSISSFSWDSSSNDWHVSQNLLEATKRINSVTPLFLSAPQFFPGCRICIEIQKRDIGKYPEEGLALVQPWVQFSSLCQEGTLFLSLAGQLFVDGKYIHSFPSTSSNKIMLTFESSSHVASLTEEMRVGFFVTYESDTLSVEWNLRGHERNTYIAVQLNNQGSCASIKS